METIEAGRHPVDGSILQINTFPDAPQQYLTYHIGAEAHRRAEFQGYEFDPSEWPLTLAEYDPTTRTLKTYPVFLDPSTRVYTRPKYQQIQSISFEDQELILKHPDFELDFDLPTGFVRNPFGGFGLDPRIKYIVQALYEVPGATGITICNDDRISMRGSEIRLPEYLYHDVRLNINRAHNAAVSFANGEKLSYLKNRLLPPIVPDFAGEEYERSTTDLQDTVKTALGKRGIPRSRNSNAAAAVRTVMRSVDEIAKDDPVQLFELSEKLELVTLAVLIARMAAAMAEGHKEGYWQTFFKANPFIFKMLFGLPVVLYADQASVGGMGHHRHGEKYADFLLEAGNLGNLAIVEIKTPGTYLMHNTAYREPTLYRPHKELAGGVNQVLEQRYNLISSIHAKRSIDDNIQIQAWSVPCFLIVGTSPTDKWVKQSFELFRGNQREVVIVTFDELLSKLRGVHDFLSTERNAE